MCDGILKRHATSGHRLRLALTLAISAAGAALAYLLGLPLPFLLGPLLACLAAALAGLPLKGHKPTSDAMRTVLGVAIGATITPALFARLPEMAASVALVPLLIVAIGVTGYPVLRRLFGFDAATAWYGAMPGGLQDMLAFGEEAGGDVRALGLIHATRVLIVVTVLPFFMAGAMGLDLSQPPGEPAASVPPHELAVQALCAVGGWWIAARVGLFGASILGPMIAAAALSLTDVLHVRPPQEAIVAAQFFIGFGVGVKYVGVTAHELRRDVLAGIVYTAAIMVVAGVFAAVSITLVGTPLVESLLAFSPGGQAEMVILALVAGADVAFVVTHHVTRLVLVILGAPLARRWLG